MVVHRLAWLPVTAILAVCTLGCQARSIDPNRAADAQQAYDRAMSAVRDEDFQAATDLFTQALEPGGGLPPDIYADALLQRALSLARLERYDEALADLNIAAEGSPNMSGVHAVRAYVLTKQGKDSEARAAMSEARRIDPRIKPLRD